MYEVLIARESTVFDPQHPRADDAQVGVRAQLLDQLAASQSAIASVLADVGNADPTLREQLRGQLSTISGLLQQVSTASRMTLGTLHAQVAAVVSSAANAAQEAQASAQLGSASQASLASLANAAREQTNATMAGMKDFDRYLQFGPGDGEAEYRQREAERRAYIAANLAKGTPQCDLNAGGGALGQMADAAARGAASSPEFQQRWDALASRVDALRAETIRKGDSTKEFDDRLREDLRRILKSKGLSDAQIDARLAAHADNPLEAAKAFVNGEGDLATLGLSVDRVAEKAIDRPTVKTTDNPTPMPGLEDVMAEFRATGTTVADHSPDVSFEHGVRENDRASPPGRSGPA